MAAFSVALLAGCGSSTPSSTPPAKGSGTQSGAAAASTPPAPAKVALPTGGKCVLITKDQAGTLLGSAPRASSGGASSERVIKIDGCTYIGTANNLGYDVNDVSAAGDPKVIVQMAMAAAAKAPGAKKFDVPGGDASVGFTMAVGPKTMARIEIAKDRYTVAVNATSADPAKAKQIALAAAATLLAAIG